MSYGIASVMPLAPHLVSSFIPLARFQDLSLDHDLDSVFSIPPPPNTAYTQLGVMLFVRHSSRHVPPLHNKTFQEHPLWCSLNKIQNPLG